jgi:C-terminal processing protease CtpA/Prc
VRGSTPSAAFQVLAHLIDHEIKSPYYDTPIVELIGIRRYERVQSSIFPLAPRLSARIIFLVDGRTASSSETILQYAHAAQIGRVIGEPTAGTNGDVATFDTVGGMRVRFTGLRILNQDGSPFHGRGIRPDVVVHPTVAGIRAGRDEILEAAIARASAP